MFGLMQKLGLGASVTKETGKRPQDERDPAQGASEVFLALLNTMQVTPEDPRAPDAPDAQDAQDGTPAKEPKSQGIQNIASLKPGSKSAKFRGVISKELAPEAQAAPLPGRPTPMDESTQAPSPTQVAVAPQVPDPDLATKDTQLSPSASPAPQSLTSVPKAQPTTVPTASQDSPVFRATAEPVTKEQVEVKKEVLKKDEGIALQAPTPAPSKGLESATSTTETAASIPTVKTSPQSGTSDKASETRPQPLPLPDIPAIGTAETRTSVDSRMTTLVASKPERSSPTPTLPEPPKTPGISKPRLFQTGDTVQSQFAERQSMSASSELPQLDQQDLPVHEASSRPRQSPQVDKVITSESQALRSSQAVSTTQAPQPRLGPQENKAEKHWSFGKDPKTQFGSRGSSPALVTSAKATPPPSVHNQELAPSGLECSSCSEDVQNPELTSQFMAPQESPLPSASTSSSASPELGVPAPMNPETSGSSRATASIPTTSSTAPPTEHLVHTLRQALEVKTTPHDLRWTDPEFGELALRIERHGDELEVSIRSALSQTHEILKQHHLSIADELTLDPDKLRFESPTPSNSQDSKGDSDAAPFSQPEAKALQPALSKKSAKAPRPSQPTPRPLTPAGQGLDLIA